MVSFAELWHILENEDDALDDSQAMEAIRSGLNLNKDGCDFWDNFIQVCGNADAMSQLLDIPREKVTSWGGKIRDLIDKVTELDNNGTKKKTVMPTGEHEGTPTADFGQDGTVAMGNDTNPLPS